jgi:hypothetical protein
MANERIGETRHPSAAETPSDKPFKSDSSLSMHDTVEVWCDCCSCEAEPYWVEAFAQDAEKHRH